MDKQRVKYKKRKQNEPAPKQKLKWWIAIVGIVVFLIGCAGYYAGNPHEKFGPYDVISVVDGDTMHISIDGKDTKVRVIGIDTPESVAADESRNTVEGEMVSEYVKELLEGKQVYLEYDEELTDTYGRTLAYLYLEDKETMLEEMLLSQGIAKVMTVEPNTRYEYEFEKLEKKAMKNGEGYWGTGFFEVD